jgi:hypothetical protein
MIRRLLPLLLLPACAGTHYLDRRFMDLTDVVDAKYGTGIGLGAKVEATMFLGAGLGFSSQSYTREWFGRRSIEVHDGAFFHAILGGGDGLYVNAAPGQGSANGFGYDFVTLDGPAPGDPPWLDWWRFGAEVCLPGVNGGLYLNLGEVWDLLAGVVTLDPAGDDGMLKGAHFLGPPAG